MVDKRKKRRTTMEETSDGIYSSEPFYMSLK